MILDMLENKFKDSFNKVFKSITTDNGIEFLDPGLQHEKK